MRMSADGGARKRRDQGRQEGGAGRGRQLGWARRRMCERGKGGWRRGEAAAEEEEEAAARQSLKADGGKLKQGGRRRASLAGAGGRLQERAAGQGPAAAAETDVVACGRGQAMFWPTRGEKGAGARAPARGGGEAAVARACARAWDAAACLRCSAAWRWRAGCSAPPSSARLDTRSAAAVGVPVGVPGERPW